MFGGMLGDLDDDPFFGGQMRRMNQMMNSMLRDPFADMFGGGLFAPPPLMLQAPQTHHHQARHNRHGQVAHQDYGPGAMSPFGVFPNLGQMFDMANASNCAQFSSMQVMTMTSGPDGRPQIYQASSSTRQGPNGVRETKKTVADSRTGVKKMSIGHHIHDRAHIIEREQNVYSGDQEERQEYVNLEEEEAEHFDKEWQEKARGMRRNEAIAYGGNDRHRQRPGNEGTSRSEMLALPSTVPSQKKNGSDERGKKRKSSDPVVVEIDSDTEEPENCPSISKRKSRRCQDDDGVTITEVDEPESNETRDDDNENE